MSSLFIYYKVASKYNWKIRSGIYQVVNDGSLSTPLEGSKKTIEDIIFCIILDLYPSLVLEHS